MDDKISKSAQGQNEPPPCRAEKDAASSSGGGRKAIEADLDQDLREGQEQTDEEDGEQKLEPPIGLDIETRADEEWSESLYEDNPEE